MDDPNVKDFESALAELEKIVETLEDGQLPLERSLERFERGIALSRYCHARLEDAERRVEVLTERGRTRPAPADIVGAGTAADAGTAAGESAADGGGDDGSGDDDVRF